MMSQKYVGVDLGSHRVKVVVLNSSLRGTQVVDVFDEPIGAPEVRENGETVDPFSHMLSVTLSVLRSRNLLREQVGIALPPEILSYRLLDFPFSDERRIAQMVPFEADGQFALPLDQLLHGHCIVQANEGGRALVVAARRDKLEQISALFRRAGAEIKVMTSPAIASAQVVKVEPETVALSDANLKPAAILLDIGHRFTHLTCLGAKGPVAVRTLRRGGRNITQAIASHYHLDVAAAEQAKCNDAFVPHHGIGSMDTAQLEAGRLVAEELEPLLRELEQTRLWLRSTQQLETTQILLAGGGSELRGLLEYLQEQTGLTVRRAHAHAQGLRVGGDAEAWTTNLPALGAAYGAARRPLIALHDGHGSGDHGDWLQDRMPSLLAIAVAILAFGALDTIAKVRAANAELEAYEGQLRDLSKEVFGETLDPVGVEKKLALAEGPDLTSLIPYRSALDVLAMVTKVATPSDLKEAEQKAAEEAVAASLPFAGQGAPDEAESTSVTESELKSVDPNAGVVAADELTISEVQVLERKLEVHASANVSSAQDRFAAKLGQLPCVSSVLKGKVKGNERRSFEMSIEHNCYRKDSVKTEEDED